VNKHELVAAVAATTALPYATVEEVLNETMEEIASCVGTGEPVKLRLFGVFVAQPQAARTGRNPRTGEAVHIPATTVVRFRPSQNLKNLVADSAVDHGQG